MLIVRKATTNYKFILTKIAGYFLVYSITPASPPNRASLRQRVRFKTHLGIIYF